MSTLFCLGLGYSAEVLARRLSARGWPIIGTSTSAEGAAKIAALGYEALIFDGRTPGGGVALALRRSTHVLISAPPGAAGDPVLHHHVRDLADARNVDWIGYLSTIGVYGDWQGDWVDETTEPRPGSERSKRRLDAEQAWLALGQRIGCRVEVFRLAGIYGPGRSALDNVRDGSARRIVKPGQVFNRIHVADIANVLAAAIARQTGDAIFNVTDDEPAAPQDVLEFAAQLLGRPLPPQVPFEAAELSPMAQSFYAENKRVRNARIKDSLGVALEFPTYRQGLRALALEPS